MDVLMALVEGIVAVDSDRQERWMIQSNTAYGVFTVIVQPAVFADDQRHRVFDEILKVLESRLHGARFAGQKAMAMPVG